VSESRGGARALGEEDASPAAVRRDMRRLFERAIESREEALLWESLGLAGPWERPMPGVPIGKPWPRG
jgi:hypothetical protein